VRCSLDIDIHIMLSDRTVMPITVTKIIIYRIDIKVGITYHENA